MDRVRPVVWSAMMNQDEYAGMVAMKHMRRTNELPLPEKWMSWSPEREPRWGTRSLVAAAVAFLLSSAVLVWSLTVFVDFLPMLIWGNQSFDWSLVRIQIVTVEVVLAAGLILNCAGIFWGWKGMQVSSRSMVPASMGVLFNTVGACIFIGCIVISSSALVS